MIRALCVLLMLAGMAPAAAAADGPQPFFLDIDASFELTDHEGRQRSAADFAGRPMLIFFGYATCESICTVALPAMGEALHLLGADAGRLAPILITIDPETDTPDALAAALPAYHPAMIGLTGSEAALAEAREAFQVEREVLFETPDGQPVYAHGSFIFLTDKAGKVQSMLPPILAPERIAELIRAQL